MTDPLTRRELLRVGLGITATAIVGTALDACASPTDTDGGVDAGMDRPLPSDTGSAGDSLAPMDAPLPDAGNGDSAAGDSSDEDAAVADATPPDAMPPLPPYGPRPFYVVAHNPNTIAEVRAALDAGANAIEPDINVYADRPGELCVSHGEGSSSAPSLVAYLTELHAIAMARPALSLIVFDCKPPAVSAAMGARILDAIRTHLTYDNDLNVIISVSEMSSTSKFDIIRSGLRAREGIMVDEENDPVAVSNYFASIGVTNHGYGNGISVLNSILGPNVRPSMERACELRAGINRPRFIYVWTVNDSNLEREHIRIGVDGIITDQIPELRRIVDEPAFRTRIRMAVRADNPMQPANAAYGLTIHTGDVGSAGTDANVTFTVNGSRGSASVTVDTRLSYRMERNDTNYVTLPSADLGTLRSITVQRDDSGNAPGWFLDTISVRSFRYGTSARATFNRWIDNTAPYNQALV